MSDDELVEAAKIELRALRDAVERRVAEVTRARAQLDELVGTSGVGVMVVDRSGRVLASDGVTPPDVCDAAAEAVSHDWSDGPAPEAVVANGWRLEFHPLVNESDAIGVVVIADSAPARVQGA